VSLTGFVDTSEESPSGVDDTGKANLNVVADTVEALKLSNNSQMKNNLNWL
jgi:hypothetical protein